MKINDIPEQRRTACVPLQLIRIMKLTAIIITFFLLQVSAATKAQITLNEKKAPLQKVLESISTQSGYDFIYSTQDLKDLKTGTIKLNNVPIETALKVAFDGQPLQYEIADKTVMVKRKEEKSVPDKLKDIIPLVDLQGRVIDEKNQPLPGVNIRVKGTNNGTIADGNGNFTLKKVDENATLVISFIGYVSQEVKANSDLSNIKLAISTSKLDAVEIIAYGTTSKRFSTTNIGSIKAEDIEKQPVGNLAIALEGRVPGLFIQQTTGNAIGSVNINVQGRNSLTQGYDPLYVVDGVPYPNTNTTFLEGGIAGPPYNNTLNFLNPNDIENVEILKDADATAIYGSRAANGAILITTKKGKAGLIQVNLNMQTGGGKITRTEDVLNTQQYVALRKEAIQNAGQAISDQDYDINGVWDQNRNINWQKELAWRL